MSLHFISPVSMTGKDSPGKISSMRIMSSFHLSPRLSWFGLHAVPVLEVVPLHLLSNTSVTLPSPPGLGLTLSIVSLIHDLLPSILSHRAFIEL